VNTLICKECGAKFPNRPPHRRTGRYVGDIVTCPQCGSRGTPKAFMENLSSPGIGIQLQRDPNFKTPAQIALQQIAQKLDNKGFTKLADKIDYFTIEIGDKGLDNSHQQKFPKNVKCNHCGGDARIAFTLLENAPIGSAIADIHQNRKNSMWLHDCSAFAVYLCKKCLKPTALYNQA